MSPELFGDIVRMLRAQYTVLSLNQLLAAVREKRPFTGREVVITFDDGYLDNFEFAVPILSDLGLPATFYITAGYVGTKKQFPWDTSKGRTTVMMEWHHVREMYALGFDIGCHTWSHPDLGKEPISSATRELDDARARLQDEIGAPVSNFAYPFGGPGNIRPEWIDAIRARGFASNVHCHGGQVFPGDDPYWIAREGCHQRTVTDVRIITDDPW